MSGLGLRARSLMCSIVRDAELLGSLIEESTSNNCILIREGDNKWSQIMRTVANDGFLALLIWRLRESSIRLNLRTINSILRRVQTLRFGMEIDARAEIGEGVWFVHTVGTVIGGNSHIGNRVRMMGNNTLGTNGDDGYPTIGDEVYLGVGARVLGRVSVGKGAKVGAGAVVLKNVPPYSTAVGVPARIIYPKVDARME